MAFYFIKVVIFLVNKESKRILHYVQNDTTHLLSCHSERSEESLYYQFL